MQIIGQVESPDKFDTGQAVERILGAVVRGRWIILASLLFFVIICFLYLHFATPVYKASARLLVNARSVESSLFLDVVRRLNSDKNFAQNELIILKSQSLAVEVAEQLFYKRYIDTVGKIPLRILRPAIDSGYSAETMGQVAGLLSSSVDFDVIPETDVISIDARSNDPREAAIIANAYADTYYKRNIQTSRSKSRAFMEFLRVQMDDKRHELAQTEDTLKSYMRLHGIVSLDEESKKLIEQLSKLESERDETEISIRALRGTISSYEAQVPGQESSLAKEIGEANDPYIRLLQEQLAKLEVQRDLTVAQNPKNIGKDLYDSKIREIDDQISALRVKLQHRTTEFLKSLIPSDQTGSDQRDPAGYLKTIKQKIISSTIDLQALQTRKTTLDSTISSYDVQFSRIPNKTIDYARLERARLSNEKLFLTLQEKYNEATITEQSEFGYIDVIDRALTPQVPYSPKVKLVILLSIAAGLMFGFTIVIARERMDVRVQTPDDLKRIGLSVVGTIMQIPSMDSAAGEKKPIVLEMPFSESAESFRHLRTNLRYNHRHKDPRTILLTSSKPGEGKTTIASNLAITFAEAGKKVLLIDADLRKPALHTVLGYSGTPGLSDCLRVLSPFEQAVQQTAIDGLSFVSCGSHISNPAELLGSQRMQGFLHAMAQRYEMLFIDSSPVLAGTDPTLISTLVDMVVLVASAGDTRINEIQQSIEHLELVMGRKPYIVLNKFNLHKAYGIPYGRSGFGYYHTVKQ